MKVSCQACGAKYTIADEKVRGRKVKIRCKSCGTPIVVDGASSTPPEAAAATAAVTAGAAAPAAAGPAWSVNLSDTDQRTMTTQEIVQGWKAGIVTNDAFVWKDGMGDWVAILECAELKALLPAPAAAAVPTPAPAAAGGTPFGPTIVTAAAVSSQARLAGGGRQGVDLFDATDGPDEDDVATSAPHLPMAGTSAYDDKMTGARNENSVLFSLDSLKGGLTGGPSGGEKKAAKAPARPGAPAEDPFAMGGGDVMGTGPAPLFSLNANQALLTAPAPPEPPPPRFDASGAPAKPVNKLLVYGGAAGGAVILLLVGLLIGRGGRDEDPAAEGSAKATSSAEAESGEKKEKKADEPKAEEKTAEKKPEDAPATASAAPSAGPAKVAAGSNPGTSSGSGSKTPAAPSTGAGKTPSEPKKEEPSAVGTAPFSVSAAQVALTQAAGNASGCAKPGGPTGSGKATVTFAPSGRVTTANVLTPPFAGTPVGGCVAGVFRKARVPAFNGNPVTVSKSFTIR
jgi:predicted Zn finger-like uncharacterized protein